MKGYSINVTESCDDGDVLNLIGHVDVRQANTPDVDFLQDDIKKAEDVFTSKVEAAHADGAYHSPDNQSFCKDNGRNIELHLHAIQGLEGRYDLNFVDDNLVVFDTLTAKSVSCTQVTDKKGIVRWRIKLEKGYRYFSKEQVNNCLIRKKIAATPLETLQKRNNVEATLFQLAYHFPNNKTRYRGLIRHQIWANARCLWVNFVRLFKYIEKVGHFPSFFGESPPSPSILSCFGMVQTFVLRMSISLPVRFRKNPVFIVLEN